MRFLANLAAVLVRPRTTMARVLEQPGRRAVLLLFVLSVVSGIVGDFDAPTMRRMLQHADGARVAWIVAGAVVAMLVVGTAVCWFYAYVPYFAGRFLGGTGDIHGVRAAAAWGLAPVVWALVYRVPAAFWSASSRAASVRMRDGVIAFDPGRLTDGCVVALVELAVFIWCAFVMSNTLAEAHRFSALHGLGTLVISAIVPVVVVVAAVLAVT